VTASVRINGALRLHTAGSVADLLDNLGVDMTRPGVAVALNGRLVPRSRWSEQAVSAGDDIDVVRPAQGG
jgi:sulfur carrier protein